MGPYQRICKEVARAIRFSGLGVRSVGPVGDFLDIFTHMHTVNYGGQFSIFNLDFCSVAGLKPYHILNYCRIILHVYIYICIYPVILRILGFFSSSFSREIEHLWLADSSNPMTQPGWHWWRAPEKMKGEMKIPQWK